MNPRQRRGALLLLLTALLAICVFVAVLAYVASVQSQVGSLIEVATLKEPVAAHQPVQPGMVTMTEVPARWAASGAVRDIKALAGLVAATDYPAGTLLQEGMLVPPPALEPGHREIAILVDTQTGVAGKIRPGDRVDIIATISGNQTTPSRAELWASNALVLSVGRAVEDGADPRRGAFSGGSGVPVTFSLPADDAIRLSYAGTFADVVWLALRNAGDTSELPSSQWVFSDERIPAAGGNQEQEADR